MTTSIKMPSQTSYSDKQEQKKNGPPPKTERERRISKIYAELNAIGKSCIVQ